MTRKRVQLILGIIVGAFFIALSILSLNAFPGSSVVDPSSANRIVDSSLRFWLLFVFGLVALGYMAYRNHKQNKGLNPPAWAYVIFLGVNAMHWLLWGISNETWSAWLYSNLFWPINIAILLAIYFIGNKNAALRYVGGALLILVAIAGISGLAKKIQRSNKEDTTRMIAARVEYQRLHPDEAWYRKGLDTVIVATRDGFRVPRNNYSRMEWRRWRKVPYAIRYPVNGGDTTLYLPAKGGYVELPMSVKWVDFIATDSDSLTLSVEIK